MNGDNRKWMVDCPACYSTGQVEHSLVKDNRIYGNIVVRCVWCNGQGAISLHLANKFLDSHMQIAFKIRNAVNN